MPAPKDPLKNKEWRERISQSLVKQYKKGIKRGFQKGHKFFGDLSKPNYFQQGEHNGVEFKKGQEKSKNWKKIMSERIDDKHSSWKGDEVGYHALHCWVLRRKGNPKFCEHCGKKGIMLKRFWSIDWANIDHKYRRVLDDYIGLCKKCHSKYDKEHNNKIFNSYK